jgi:23S rRNA (guanosine2251-2'-O)-methyltransferase
MEPNQKDIIFIAHDIRSCENVGSILRTADAMAINKIYFTGITPYPIQQKDKRLPHIMRANHSKITKSALGAEKTVANQHHEDIEALVSKLKKNGYSVCGLEQHNTSKQLNSLSNPSKIAVILGNEVNGLDKDLVKLCNFLVEIPMLGQKESLNVAQAAAIAMFYGRYF